MSLRWVQSQCGIIIISNERQFNDITCVTWIVHPLAILHTCGTPDWPLAKPAMEPESVDTKSDKNPQPTRRLKRPNWPNREPGKSGPDQLNARPVHSSLHFLWATYTITSVTSHLSDNYLMIWIWIWSDHFFRDCFLQVFTQVAQMVMGYSRKCQKSPVIDWGYCHVLIKGLRMLIGYWTLLILKPVSRPNSPV